MSGFYIIFFSVLAAANVLYCSASYYNCENGIYDTLYHVTEECRRVHYSPNLRDLRKKQKHVSGKDIADMFQDYCSVTEDVTSCVERYINDLPCLGQEMDAFHNQNSRSNWYCDGNVAKDVITDIYNNLPMENLNYRQNECYKEAPTRAYPCIKRYLNIRAPPDSKRERMKRILSSFRCTFRKLVRKCGRNSSLLLTTLEYDWLLIPPILGINVSDTLITVANIKFS